MRPEWQAEPVAAAIDGRAREQLLAVEPGEADVQRVRQSLLGMAVEREAGHGGPQRRVQAVAQRSDLQVRAAAQPSPASAQAAPRPAMYGTFSVPARRPLSWPAPWTSGSSRVPGRTYRAPIALRGVQLVPGDGQQVDAERVHVERDLADRLRGVGVDERRRARAPRAAISAMGWSVPTSLLACMTLTSTVPGSIARRTSSGSTTP